MRPEPFKVCVQRRMVVSASTLLGFFFKLRYSVLKFSKTSRASSMNMPTNSSSILIGATALFGATISTKESSSSTVNAEFFSKSALPPVVASDSVAKGSSTTLSNKGKSSSTSANAVPGIPASAAALLAVLPLVVLPLPALLLATPASAMSISLADSP